MRILSAPNSFKGGLSSPLAAEAIKAGLLRSGLDCRVELMPIADGGDDTMEVLVGKNGRIVEMEVVGPLGEPVMADYGIMADGVTAVIEMARASGLKLLKPEERNPLITTTYGTGQLILAALDAGCTKILVGVGGSATVDGGSGCLKALGGKLLDEDGREIGPGGGPLAEVASIDLSGLDERLSGVSIEVACDVTNPTLGPIGAAAVFGPQKGATPEQVDILEANLKNLFTVAAEQVGVDVRNVERGGAAGALSAGLVAFCGASLRSGIELVLEQLDIDNRLVGVDLVITGEGQIDTQTLGGKGPMGLTEAARKYGIPVVALAGSVGEGEQRMAEAGIKAVLPIWPGGVSLEEAMTDSSRLIEETSCRLGRILAIGR